MPNPAFVQDVHSTAGAVTHIDSPSISVTQGDFLMAMFAFGTGPWMPTIQDTAGNTWHPVHPASPFKATLGGVDMYEYWAIANATGPTVVSYDLTSVPSTVIDLMVAEFSNTTGNWAGTGGTLLNNSATNVSSMLGATLTPRTPPPPALYICHFDLFSGSASAPLNGWVIPIANDGVSNGYAYLISTDAIAKTFQCSIPNITYMNETVLFQGAVGPSYIYPGMSGASGSGGLIIPRQILLPMETRF